MRRRMTAEERRAHGERMRRAWAEGKMAHRRRGLDPDRWTPREDAALAELGGTMPMVDLIDALERRFSRRRTMPAVRIRAKRLGISLWQRSLCLRDLVALFGVDHRVISRHWIEPGHIVGRRWDGRGPNRGWWFEHAEVERFIREEGWLYDVTRMPKGHRLTRLAELTARRDPWIAGLEALGAVLARGLRDGLGGGPPLAPEPVVVQADADRW